MDPYDIFVQESFRQYHYLTTHMCRPSPEHLCNPVVPLLVFYSLLFESYDDVATLQPSYRYGFAAYECYVDCLDSCIRYVVGGEDIQVKVHEDFSVMSGRNDHIWLAHIAARCLVVCICCCNVRPYRLY